MIWLRIVAFFAAYSAAIAALAPLDIGSSAGFVVQEADPNGSWILVIVFGSFLGAFVASAADRFGRRSVVLWSVASFAVLTGMSAAVTNNGVFQALQLLDRIFITSAYTVAIAIIAEESSAEGRGRAIGAITALSALGVALAFGYPAYGTALFGNRGLYLIGLAPLLLVLFASRVLGESRRFTELNLHANSPGGKRVILHKYRPQLVQVGLLFFSSHFASIGILTGWAYWAPRERGLPPASIARYFVAAYLAGAVGAYVAGRLQDRAGRRQVGIAFGVAATLFGALAFRAEGSPGLVIMLVLAAFFGLGSHAVSNAYASELFPTEIRASALGVSRAVFGTLGAITGPIAVSLLGDGNSDTLANRVWLVALGYLVVAGIVRLLPETAGRSLEEIAATAEIPAKVTAPYLYSHIPAPAPRSPIEPRRPQDEEIDELFRP